MAAAVETAEMAAKVVTAAMAAMAPTVAVREAPLEAALTEGEGPREVRPCAPESEE